MAAGIIWSQSVHARNIQARYADLLTGINLANLRFSRLACRGVAVIGIGASSCLSVLTAGAPSSALPICAANIAKS